MNLTATDVLNLNLAGSPANVPDHAPETFIRLVGTEHNPSRMRTGSDSTGKTNKSKKVTPKLAPNLTPSGKEKPMTDVAIEPTGLQTTVGKLLVSEAEAARMLSMSPRQLANLRYAGRVKFICLNLIGDSPSSKRGRRSIRYSVESLKTMIAEMEAAGTGEVNNGRTE